MSAQDKPGVLSEIAQILSDSGISIEALIQKEISEEASEVPVIILTNRTQERLLNKAVALLQALETVSGEITTIRVESLG